MLRHPEAGIELITELPWSAANPERAPGSESEPGSDVLAARQREAVPYGLLQEERAGGQPERVPQMRIRGFPAWVHDGGAA
jgi:hypothetical protein